MISVELFIDNQQLDTFKDEGINITDSIQNARQPDKIFTSFSKQFSLPATPNNNKIFKHFYNFDIDNGFDARKRAQSLIKVNGVDFKQGFIQLNGVTLKYGKANTYNVFFTGLFSELKDLIKDDNLSVLRGLDQYNHKYTQNNVKTGFTNFCNSTNGTLTPNAFGGVCYPFITHTQRYTYTDNNGIRNVDEDGNVGNKSLETTELKPAIRIKAILEAIEEQYDITFESDFFNDFTFRQLFMWLHRKEGEMNTINERVFTIRTTLDVYFLAEESVSDFFNPLPFIAPAPFPSIINTNNRLVNLVWSLAFNNTGFISYEVIDGLTGNVLVSEENVSTQSIGGINLVTIEVETDASFINPTLRFSTASPALTEAEIFFKIESTTNDDFRRYELKANPLDLGVSDVVITDQIPSMTVVDFLTSLFKMFNLTAVAKSNKVIEVEPLDDFYSKGIEKDLTDKIDVEKSNIDKVNPFSAIEFNFAEASTFLTDLRNKTTDREYGNFRKDLNENVEDLESFSGGDYKIEIDFEKMIFEQLIKPNGDFTNINFGWFVDDKKEPTIGEPLIFYAGVENTGIIQGDDPIDYQGGGSTDSFVKPSNFLGLLSLNFGVEFDSIGTQTLFNKYYKNYITRVFNKKSRLNKVTAYLPSREIVNYNLNDIVLIDNKRFLINKIDIKLNTGKATLELINF